jgi:uncharacterized membrane protein YcaP (DUF421 family)
MEIIGTLLDAMKDLLGLDDSVENLAALQMVLRSVVVYVFSLLIVKSAKKRFMGQNSALDVVVIIILGSVLSRAINGSAPFVASLWAGFALVVIHRLMCWASFRWRRFARFVEGEPARLVTDGKIDWNQMRKHDITEKDLESALRSMLNSDDMSKVKHIYLEPSGKISIVENS